MNTACITLGAACLLYYAVMAVYAGPSVNFGWFWIALGAAFLLAAYLDHFNAPALIWCRRALLALLGAGILLILLLSIPVIRGMVPADADPPGTVIVLGAQVRGTRPSRSLLKRLEKAEAFARENPDSVLILSGGKGEDEEISEAQCMWNWLTEAGIDEKRLIKEDRSTTTRENLVFSDRLAGCAKDACGIISNNFHICRALRIARREGYADPVGIPAAGDPLMQVHNVVRETAALAAEMVRERKIW